MTDLRDDRMVHLTVDDARAAQAAGTKFARTLAGARSADFALAVAEQERLIWQAVTDTGHSADLAMHAAKHFGAAARDEWQRIADASGGDIRGTA